MTPPLLANKLSVAWPSLVLRLPPSTPSPSRVVVIFEFCFCFSCCTAKQVKCKQSEPRAPCMSCSPASNVLPRFVASSSSSSRGRSRSRVHTAPPAAGPIIIYSTCKCSHCMCMPLSMCMCVCVCACSTCRLNESLLFNLQPIFATVTRNSLRRQVRGKAALINCISFAKLTERKREGDGEVHERERGAVGVSLGKFDLHFPSRTRHNL